MKVLIVTAMFPPIRTGTSFYSRNLAAALAARGHQVKVVALGPGEKEDRVDAFAIYRLPAIRVPIRGFFKHFSIASIFPRSYVRMARLAHDADVIVLVNHYLDIAFPAVFAARKSGTPLVCSVGTQLQSSHRVRHRLLNMLDRAICGRIIFSSCARVVAWDDQILCYLRDVHGTAVTDKTEIVNYGVNGDPQKLASHEHDYALHNQILGVGSVIEQRDYAALVRAFSLVASEFPALTLKIIGHVYRDRAVRLAAELGLGDRVRFVGERPHSEVLAEIQRSDVYFVSLTGRYTGVGTATIETMLLGVPTLVNAYPGILGRAQIKDMHDMALLDGLAPEVIADRLRLLLRNSELRRSIGQTGRRFVMQNMSWTKIGGDFESVLESVLATRRAKRRVTD